MCVRLFLDVCVYGSVDRLSQACEVHVCVCVCVCVQVYVVKIVLFMCCK